MKPMKKIIHSLTNKPKQMFLLDAFGALLTAMLLIGVLVPFQEVFGMPILVLYTLSGFGLFFFIYSLSCSLFLKNKFKPFLLLIMVFNVLYTLFSIILVFNFYDKMTQIGVIYFLAEILVIAFVVMLEYKSYKNLAKIN